MSYPALFWAAAIPIGLLFLGLTPAVLTSSQAGHLGGGVVFLVGGLGFLGEGVFVLLSTAVTVVRYSDGSFLFTSRRRSLLVAPGELRSIRCIWIDPHRLGPMRVRSKAGTTFVFPRIPDAKDLFDDLVRLNPGAAITSPVPYGAGLFRRD